MTKEDVLKLLPNGSMGIFSTVGGNGFPDARGWQFQFEEDGKFYFGTANTKNVYKEMKNNPNVCFTSFDSSWKYTVRIIGKATFITDASEKKEAFSKFTKSVQGMYKSSDNPILEIFYISKGTLKLAKGFNPPEEIKF